MNLVSFINKTINFILNTLFPIKCLGCEIKNQILCDNCISKVRLAERETERDIMALFDYRDTIIKKAIWELKYHNKRYLGRKLGQLLYESFIEEISNLKMIMPGRSIFVIPVPISKIKNKKRGYNQAYIIAKEFCNSAPINIFKLQNKIIFKKIETIPQAKINNREQRLKNVRGVFEIKNKNLIKGQTFIIIDDVTTTGGTINEIIKILKKAGAKKVIGFTIAH